MEIASLSRQPNGGNCSYTIEIIEHRSAIRPAIHEERAHMVCPYLDRTVIPICQAKKGALMGPNIYELQYFCMSVRYKECPIFRKHGSADKGGKEKKKAEKNAITK
jgi:hypothetical protein